MANSHTPETLSTIGRLFASLSGKPVACRALCSLAVVVAVSGCALDGAKLERTRQDIETLCENPVTASGKRLCARLEGQAAGAKAYPMIEQ